MASSSGWSDDDSVLVGPYVRIVAEYIGEGEPATAVDSLWEQTTIYCGWLRACVWLTFAGRYRLLPIIGIIT